MNEVRVGIGEYAVSSDPDEIIKTFALGSCVAVIIYDTQQRTAGLLHAALPDSSINPERAQRTPGYFVDTGIPALLAEMKRHGAGRNHSWIKLVGGALVMDTTRRFDIGRRNVLAVKKLLWKNRLGVLAEEVGGSASRTVSIRVADGTVEVFSGGERWELV